VTLFYLPSLPALSRPRANPFGPLLTLLSLPSVGGVPISSGSGNSSTTIHGECFAPSFNRGRASVSRKGDVGPLSPRVRRGALLVLASRPPVRYSLPGRAGGVVALPPNTQTQFTGGGLT
jgi:hypothetical protein